MRRTALFQALQIVGNTLQGIWDSIAVRTRYEVFMAIPVYGTEEGL